jgi:hypothetical protein
VRSSFGQRALALAAVTLFAGVLAVAVAHQKATPAQAAGPQPAVGAGTGWYAAIAGVASPFPAKGRRSACGWLLLPGTLGVVHPVLPCGTKIFVQVGGKRIYTEVVDRGPVASREDFDLTPALGEKVGLTTGTRDVRWAFAR